MTNLLKYHLTIKWNDQLVFDGRMTAVMVKDILDRVCIANFNGEPALEAARTVPSLATITYMAGGDQNQLSILCPTGTLYALVTRMHDTDKLVWLPHEVTSDGQVRELAAPSDPDTIRREGLEP